MQKNVSKILEDLLLWLKSQRDSGADFIPRQTLELAERLKMKKTPGKSHEQAAALDLDTVKDLETLKAVVEKCSLCPLSKTRNKVVFGEGPSHPAVMIIGEAPGRKEDLEGRPFVGKSGELLTRMLRAINMDRQEVFITSVIKCRPPGNRTPLQEEIRACMPYLERQIALLSPKIILCLGGTAAQSLLGTNKSLTSLRGKFFDYNHIKVIVTYHPAYLLRFGGMKQKEYKKKAWHDLQMLQREYEKIAKS